MIDLFHIDEMYRKFYSHHRKSKKTIPSSHIDICSTYVLSGKQEDLDLLNVFSNGMSAKEFEVYFKFIVENMPISNLKIIVELKGEIYPVFFYQCGDTIAISIESKYNQSFSYFALACLYNTIKRLSEKNTYIASQSVEYKNKRTGKIIPSEIIYVSREKELKKVYPIFNSEIVWKHSWSVMGHWRSCRSIGKNRDGVRCVIGKTWVNPSVKGNGPFIEKTRVVS